MWNHGNGNGNKTCFTIYGRPHLSTVSRSMFSVTYGQPQSESIN